MKRLVILGAGGHGRVAADIAGKTGYDSIAFLDDTKKTCGRYPVMGESARFSEYDCDFFVAIGNPQVRRRMQEMLLTAGKQVTTLIHPSAVIGEDVTLGTGTLVAAGAVINPGAVIGRHTHVYPLSAVRGTVPADSIFKAPGNIVPRQQQ